MLHSRSRTHTRPAGLFTGRRSLLSIAASLVVGGVIASMTVLPAQAAAGDVSEGEGVLLSGSGIVNVNNIAQLKGAYSSSTATSSLGTVANPLDLTALNAVNVNLGNGIQLLGNNGILTLGVNGQYANTSTTGAVASSGLVGSDGSIAVGPGTPGGTSTLNLEPLFQTVGANASIASAAQLNIGALASRIQSTRGTTTSVSKTYGIAGANVQLTSPAIAGLNTSLQTAVNTTSSTLNNTVASTGFVNSLTSGITSSLNTAIQGLIPNSNLTGTTVQASISGLNLSAVTQPVLAQTYTSGPVTINPKTGSITIDLNTLQALNGQGPNTKLLSTQALQDIVTGAIKDILVTQIPAALNTAIVSALSNATLKVTVGAGVTLLGLNIETLNLNASVPLSNLIANGTNTPATVTATLTALNGGVSIPVNVLLPALAPVVTSITSNLGTLLSPTLNGLTTTLGTTLTAANTVLTPLVGLINQVVSITVNAQDSNGGFQDSRGNTQGSTSVHALQLAILPGANVATINLATSTANTTTIAPVAITSPTANQQFTVATSTTTRSIPVSGTGEPGATIAVDLGNGHTGTATVGTDGTWSTTVSGIGVGTVTASATQTFNGVAGTPVTQTFSVVAQQPLSISAPTASQQFTVVSSTATRSITVSGSATPGATIALDLGGGLTASTTAGSDGSWSTSVPGVGVGSYTISATQASGGVTSAPVTRPFTVVAGAALTVTAPAANTQYVVPGSTSTTTVTVTGTAQPGAAVTADLGGGLTGTATAAADGSYSIPVTGVGTGAYTVSVTQIVGGGTSAAITRPISVVAASPIVLQSPANGGVFTVAGPQATTPVTVTGTAQAGATVNVQIATGVTATVTAGLNGAWSANFTNVGVGAYTVSATQTVAGVTSAPVTSTFSVAAAPAVTITAPAAGSSTTVADPSSTIPVTVTGTAGNNASVTVSLGSGRTQTVTASGTGTWSAPFTGVPVGGYTISATQTVNGTTSSPVTSTYSIVAGAPVAISAPAAGAAIPVAGTGSTADIPFTGTAQPGASVTVSLGSGITGTATADGSGTWTIPIAGVPTGSYTVSATETIGGTTSPAVTQPLTVQVGAPVVISNPAAGATQTVVTGGRATVATSGTAQPGASVTVSLGAGLTATTTAGPTGSWSASIANVPVGDYVLSASQTINGGTSTPVTQAFHVAAATGLVITAPSSGTTFTVASGTGTHSTTVTGVGSALANTTVTLTSPTVDLGASGSQTVATPLGSWSATFSNLPVGTYTVNASQTIAGSTQNATPTTFSISAGAPIAITSPTSATPITVATPTSTQSVAISGTAQPGAGISVTVDSGTPLTTTADASGAWSVTDSGVGVGTHAIVATQTVNGTTSSANGGFTISAGAAFTLATPVDGSTVTVADASGTQNITVSGTGDTGASVAVTTGSTTQTAIVGLNGQWSTTFLALGVGAHTFGAIETVGVTTSPVLTSTVTISAGAPVTITAPPAGDTKVVASPTATTSETVTGTNAAGATVSVSLGAGLTQEATVTGTTWTTTFANLPVGSYTAAASQSLNGTVSAPATSSFSIAAGAPVTLTAPADGSKVTVATSGSTTTIPVSGTAQPGATVNVSLGAGLTATTTADATTGAWSTSVANVPVGLQTVSATQTINGTTSAAVTSTVDVIVGAPITIQTPTEGQDFPVADASSKTTVTVAGTGQPGASIALTVNGGAPIAITVRNSGSWSTTLANTPVGSYVLSAVQTVGGTQSDPATRDFTVQAGAAVTIATPTPDQTVVVPTATSTTDVTVTGTAEPGSTVMATTDSGQAGQATTGTDGKYSVTIPDVSVGADQTISVTQSIDGTTSATPTTVTISVAAASPVTVTNPAPGVDVTVSSQAATADVPFTGTAQADATVTVSLGGGLTATTKAGDDGTWGVTVHGVPVGDYTASVTQTIAGVVSTPVTQPLSVSVAAPVVISQPTNAHSFPVANTGDTVPVPVSGTAEPGATVTVKLDGGSATTVTADGTTGAWSTSFPDVGTGSHTLSATEATSDGSTTPALAVFTVDVAPAAVITSPTAGQTFQVAQGDTATVPVSGTGLPGAGISVQLDGQGAPQTTTVDQTGTWSVQFTGVGEGDHDVTATQSVAGDTQTSVSAGFTVETTTNPAAPVEITSPDQGTVLPDTNGDGFVDVPVSGTGQPGSTITVTTATGQTATTTVGDDGTWSVTLHHVPVGVIRLAVVQKTNGTVTGSDQVGISAEALVAPAIATPEAGQPVLVTSPTATADIPVTGTGEPGASIAVDLGGGLTGTATVGDDGKWGTTIHDVPVGDHTISVTESLTGVSLPAVTQDLTVQAGTGVAVSSPADGSSVTVASSTSTTSLPVSGTADPGALVSVTIDGGTPKTVNAATDGSWSVTFPGVATGDHTISASEELADGSTTPVTSTVTVAAAAKATITTPQAGQQIQVAPGSTTVVVVSGTGAPGASVKVLLGSASQTVPVDGTGAWTATFTQVGVGTHIASATQTVLGTTQDPVTVTFSVTATSNPVSAPTITSPSSGQIIRDTDGDGTFDVPVTGTGQPGSSITVDLGDAITRTTTVGDDGTWAVTVTSVPDGTRTVVATQTTGQTVTGSASVQVTGAAIAPITVTSPTPGQTVPGSTTGPTTVTVTGTAEPGATVSVSLDNGTAITTTADGSGAWSVDVPNVGRGDHTVAVSETLGAATSAPATVPFTVAPATSATGIAILSPTPNALLVDTDKDGSHPVTVTGTSAPNAPVSVRLDGTGAVQTTTADASGAWSVTFGAVADGDHTVVATQTVMGTETSTDPQSFSLDIIDPLTLARPAPGSTYAAGTNGLASVPVMGTADPDAVVTITLDGGRSVQVQAADDGTWSYTFTGVAPGTHTYVVTQTVGAFTSDPLATTFTVRKLAVNVGPGGDGNGNGNGNGNGTGHTGNGDGNGGGTNGNTSPAGTGSDQTFLGQALAYTGSTVFPWAVVGAAFLALGLGMLGASRGLSRIRARKR
ncbi:choice-of-anchor G family protein [Frondihabitans australicus]|uniref:Uncharacterized protein n=1 Tax=Frondihabitans australicus TaxID=386892 RepID=A0A495IDQ4_9MICO|nr:choice-of-anchor G family protein [Frondihabitans australicus]RKR73136.1 hypothetical protein C8E83_0224 [Frondihabitans australicus]